MKFLIVGFVLLLPVGRAAAWEGAAEEAASVPSDAEACPIENLKGAPVPYVTPEQKRYYASLKTYAAERHQACLHEVRLRRDEPAFEARRTRRLGLSLGYDGALWVNDSGRYRAPSLQLAATFRRHYRRRLGLHVLLGGSLGAGRMGAGGFDRQSASVGLSYGAAGEVGLVIGPALRSGVYVLLTSQARLGIPGASRRRFELEGDPAETVIVRWRRPATGLGVRVGPGVMFGPRDEAFVELGMGGGGLVGRERGLFISVGVRAGLQFGA